MAKEGSVAPKERVNIVYRPATGDAREEVELPLKIKVLGNFTMRPDDRPLEDRAPINVDKDNFNDVMQSQGLELSFTVPGKLSGAPDEELAVNLKFDTLKDFEPDSLVRMAPELARLMELREALKAVKGPLSNVPDFRKKIQEIVADESTRAKIMAELKI